MATFRKYDAELAQCEAAAHREEAGGKFALHTPDWHAELVLLDLQEVVDKGVMDCCTTFADFIGELWYELPFDPADQQLCLNTVLADERLTVLAQKIAKVHDGFDVIAELRTGLRATD